MSQTTKEKFIRNIIKKYVSKEDNVIYANRLFMALSVVNHALDNNLTPKEINLYIAEAEKYLNGKTDLVWQDGHIKIKKDEAK